MSSCTNATNKNEIKWSPFCSHTKETKKKNINKRKKKNAKEQRTLKMNLMLGQLSYSLTIRGRAIYLMYSTFMLPGIIKEEQKLLHDFYFEPIVGKKRRINGISLQIYLFFIT
jgi:hypothetical protein